MTAANESVTNLPYDGTMFYVLIKYIYIEKKDTL